ncbi:hypothetical protein [Escherichia coli]|uniref:hypothetical protein n=1 Tax=Escherichia coli TaxID=562 RepID=UPI003D9A6586
MFRLFSSRAGAPQKVKLVDRGKRSAIIFCRMRVLHKTCYVPLSTGQVTDGFILREGEFVTSLQALKEIGIKAGFSAFSGE